MCVLSACAEAGLQLVVLPQMACSGTNLAVEGSSTHLLPYVTKWLTVTTL